LPLTLMPVALSLRGPPALRAQAKLPVARLHLATKISSCPLLVRLWLPKLTVLENSPVR
jgi:hypothetical protein